MEKTNTVVINPSLMTESIRAQVRYKSNMLKEVGLPGIRGVVMSQQAHNNRQFGGLTAGFSIDGNQSVHVCAKEIEADSQEELRRAYITGKVSKFKTSVGWILVGPSTETGEIVVVEPSDDGKKSCRPAEEDEVTLYQEWLAYRQENDFDLEAARREAQTQQREREEVVAQNDTPIW